MMFALATKPVYCEFFRRSIVAAIVLSAGFLSAAIAGVRCEYHGVWHKERYCWDDGRPTYVPPPPIPPHVRSTGNNQYQPEDGYTWNNPGKSGDLTVHWDPRRHNSNWPHVVASDQEGVWAPEDGYVFTSIEKHSLGVRWQPGNKHSRYPHVHAHENEGHWSPDDGYRFVDPGSHDLNVEPIPHYQEKINKRRSIKDLDSAMSRQTLTMAETLRQIRARSRDIWDAERAMNTWMSMNDAAREAARETARKAFIDLSLEGAQHAMIWGVNRIPAKDIDRIKSSIDRFTRKHGVPFRKIELYNPKFLKRAYEVIDKAHKEYDTSKNVQDAVRASEKEEYHTVTANILEAANNIFPTKYSTLISVSVKGGEIWIANVFAFANNHYSKRMVDQLSEVQRSDLEAIKSLSKIYEAQVSRQKALRVRRTQLREDLRSYD